MSGVIPADQLEASVRGTWHPLTNDRPGTEKDGRWLIYIPASHCLASARRICLTLLNGHLGRHNHCCHPGHFICNLQRLWTIFAERYVDVCYQCSLYQLQPVTMPVFCCSGLYCTVLYFCNVPWQKCKYKWWPKPNLQSWPHHHLKIFTLECKRVEMWHGHLQGMHLPPY